MNNRKNLHIALTMLLIVAILLVVMAFTVGAELALLIAFITISFIAYTVLSAMNRKKQIFMKLRNVPHIAIAVLALATFFAVSFLCSPIETMVAEAGMDKGTLAAATLVILAFSAAAFCNMQNRRTARLIDSMIHDARDAGDNRMFIILEEIKSTMRVGLYATWMVFILLLIMLFKEAKLTLLVASLLFLSIVLSILLTTLDHRTKGKLKKIDEELDRIKEEEMSKMLPNHLKN